MVLALALALSMLLLWAETTVLSPTWTRSTLRESGVYGFLRQEALPAWLDARMVEFGIEAPQHRAFAVQVFLEVVREDELRARVEQAADEVLPYLAGRTDQMSVRPRFDRWVLAIPETLARLEFPTWLVDTVLAHKLRPALEALAAEPLGVPVDPGDADQVAREIAPPEWIDAQVVGATYAVARWAVGKQRTFEIRIDYADRVEVATEVFKRLLRRSDVEQVIVDRVVIPMAEQGLAELPAFSERIDRDLLEATVRRAAPEDWLASQVDGLVDALGDWLAGRTETFSYTVQTGALAPTAEAIVTEMLDRTLGEELSRAAARPLIERVRAYFPRTTTWGEPELAGGVGQESWQQLLVLRGFIAEGFTYDQNDLRRDLQGLGLDDGAVDRMRHVLGESYVYTELDLASGGLGTDTERLLQTVRGVALDAWAAYLLALLALIALLVAAGPGGFRRAGFVAGAVTAAGLLVWAGLAPWLANALRDGVLSMIPGAHLMTEHPFLIELLGRADEAAGILGGWGRALFFVGAAASALLWLAQVRAAARARS